MAEARYSDLRHGDLNLAFDPNNYLREYRENLEARSIRLGLNHSFNPNLTMIVTGSYSKDTGGNELPDFGFLRFGKI